MSAEAGAREETTFSVVICTHRRPHLLGGAIDAVVYHQVERFRTTRRHLAWKAYCAGSSDALSSHNLPDPA